jgi:hypothetical protein
MLRREFFLKTKSFYQFKFSWPVYGKYEVITLEEIIDRKKLDLKGSLIKKELEMLDCGIEEKFIYASEREKYRLYNPMERPEVLYKLVTLFEKKGVQTDNMLDFIGKYGLPGSNDNHIGPISRDIQTGSCYRLQDFHEIMEGFYKLILLYEQVVNKDIKSLKKRIKFSDKTEFPSIYGKIHLDDDFKVLYITEGDEYLYDNYLESALRFLVGEVNLHLQGNISPIITDIISLRVNWKAETAWYCNSLLTALYFHLFNMLHEVKPFRRCLWCGGPIPHEKRADTKFCSDSCRSAYYQSKHKP